MASINLFTLSIFISLSLFSLSSTADSPSGKNVPPGTICRSTPEPSYCESLLHNRTGNVYTYGRYSIHKSLSQSRKFLHLVEKHLKRRSSFSTATILALEDCRFLAEQNLEFLLTTYHTVNTTGDQTLPVNQADDLQTLFSAIITNQQTCLDSLEITASSGEDVKNNISLPLMNDTKLNSVCLALCSRGWVPSDKKEAATWRNPSGRRLLQVNGSSDVVISDMVIVSQDGNGNFSTINEALNVAPNDTDGSQGYFLIYIKEGIYEEYVSVAKNKRFLMIMGDGINRTVITGNRSVADGWTTFNSATFIVVAPNFVMVNMTIRNTAGAIKHQAVALRSGADLSTFYRCSFEGYQDTLYPHSLRQFYRECDIYGTVDFIFGNGAVVLQNCNIYPRLPMSGQFNAITAQGRTDPNQNTGISIHNCTIRAADDLASSNQTVRTYLGRPWKEYSRTVYMQSFMDSLIEPAGWRAWSGDFALRTLYYAEYSNSGPGSDTSNRVTWPGYHVIGASTDADNFTVSGFLLGDRWLPRTGVPFFGGLI